MKESPHVFDVPWLSFVCSQIKTGPAIIFFHVVIKKAMVTSSRSGKPSVIKPFPKQRKQVKASNAMTQFKDIKEMKKSADEGQISFSKFRKFRL